MYNICVKRTLDNNAKVEINYKKIKIVNESAWSWKVLYCI